MFSAKKAVRLVFNRAGYDLRRLNELSSNPSDIHFLHIGKCAGTQIANIARIVNQQGGPRRIVKHSHDIMLGALPDGAAYFFSVRDPVARFRSAFYSRQRKGAPRHFSEWSVAERAAFKQFPHANDLAESLFAAGDLGRKAWAAINSIRHTAERQTAWFSGCGDFLSTRPPIWIIRQDQFDADMAQLLHRAGLSAETASPQSAANDATAHRNDYAGTPPLSPAAIQNLRAWYRDDVEFYQLCGAWLEERRQPLP